MAKSVSCICQHCDCRKDCEFFEETVGPVINVVEVNLYDDSDPFIKCLMRNLEEFECEYYEKEKTK